MSAVLKGLGGEAGVGLGGGGGIAREVEKLSRDLKKGGGGVKRNYYFYYLFIFIYFLSHQNNGRELNYQV